MNKAELTKIMNLYRGGGISEALIVEIFIRKHLSNIPGMELDSQLFEHNVREIATAIDIFYKSVVFEPTEKGQNLTSRLTKLVDEMPVNSEKVWGDKIED